MGIFFRVSAWDKIDKKLHLIHAKCHQLVNFLNWKTIFGRIRSWDQAVLKQRTLFLLKIAARCPFVAVFGGNFLTINYHFDYWPLGGFWSPSACQRSKNSQNPLCRYLFAHQHLTHAIIDRTMHWNHIHVLVLSQCKAVYYLVKLGYIYAKYGSLLNHWSISI